MRLGTLTYKSKYVCRGSLGVGEGATRDLRRYVVVARAKSNSRGSKRWEPAKKVSLSVCVPINLGVSVGVIA